MCDRTASPLVSTVFDSTEHNQSRLHPTTLYLCPILGIDLVILRENKNSFINIFFFILCVSCDLTFMLENFELYTSREIFEANIDGVRNCVCYSVC